MPIVYLEPRDLSALQAQQVLDFLNRATSAEQLARDIEFPNEPDIGVKLGQRLLDARTALGGSFTDIAQIRSVRLIGPERFTEICVAALGFSPSRWVELFFGGDPLGLQTETGLNVSIDVLPQPAWLGQPLSLTVRVRDHGGTPRAGVAVTVQSGIGRLVYMFGFSRIEGQAVTVITGGDGSADLELLTPPAEPLSELQQAALEVALAELDAGAADPSKLETAFRAVAANYLLERSYNLRRAIDVYVRERRDAMIDSINPGRWRIEWPVVSVLVQADALTPDGGGSSTARAVATVTWKNWVGAWLEYLADVLREGANLQQNLGAASATGKGGALVGQLLFEAQRFAALQPGRSAEWLGKREINTVMRDYVSGDLSQLDAASQAAVLTQLEVAATGVDATSLGGYTLVRTSQAELNQKIESIEAVGTLNLETLNALEADIAIKAARVDAQASEVAAMRAAVQQDRTSINQQLTTFSATVNQVDTRLNQFNTQFNQFNSQLTQFNSQVTQFNTQFSQFNTGLTRFNADLSTFNTNRTTLNARLDGLQTDLQTVRLDVNRINRPRGGGG